MPDTPHPDTLTVKELAALAGVGVGAVHSAVKRRQLRPIFPRKTLELTFTRAEAERWMAERRRKPPRGSALKRGGQPFPRK